VVKLTDYKRIRGVESLKIKSLGENPQPPAPIKTHRLAVCERIVVLIRGGVLFSSWLPITIIF